LYVQLPTAAAHEFHGDPVFDVSTEVPPSSVPSRLHPSVAQKIRDIVSGGELRQYYIRHLLRLLASRHMHMHNNAIVIIVIIIVCGL